MKLIFKCVSSIPVALGLLHLGFAVQAVFAQNDMEMVKHYLIMFAFAIVAGFVLHVSEEKVNER